MNDISACTATACPERKGCLRYRLVWDQRQSVSYFYKEGMVCIRKVDILKTDKVLPLKKADQRVSELKGS